MHAGHDHVQRALRRAVGVVEVSRELAVRGRGVGEAAQRGGDEDDAFAARLPEQRREDGGRDRGAEDVGVVEGLVFGALCFGGGVGGDAGVVDELGGEREGERQDGAVCEVSCGME